jgi:hypothetical protein
MIITINYMYISHDKGPAEPLRDALRELSNI